MSDQTKNLLIGLFVLSACVLVVWFIMFLRPSVGDMSKTYFIRFSNINKISLGTRVTYAGKPVGEVVCIREIFKARQQPTDEFGRLYVYELVVKVDSSISIYSSDQIELQTSGLLGEKSVAIIPKAPPRGEKAVLITDQPIYAESGDPLENTFLVIKDVASSVEDSFKEITNWVREHGESVATTIRSFGHAMDEADTFLNNMNEQDIVSDLKQGIQNFSTVSQDLDDAITKLQDKDFFDNLGTTMDSLKDASASISQISQDIANGKGTIGKLITQDDVYYHMNSMMSKADTLMNDINHYGILFHANKGWQRMRTQRANLLNCLDTPAGFKEYFENEVDQINTAMGRISMMIEKAENRCSEDLLNNPCFKCDFDELLRQAEELTSNLKLYNNKLINFNQKCEGE